MRQMTYVAEQYEDKGYDSYDYESKYRHFVWTSLK